jgi:hypothetical protein
MTLAANVRKTKHNPSTYVERFQLMLRKHSVQEVVRHLPAFAEILIRAAGGDAPGVATKVLGLVGAFGTTGPNQGCSDSVAKRQEQLADRCKKLEEENEKIRAEVGSLATEVSLAKAEATTFRNEVQVLRTRNQYLSLGLFIVFLLTLGQLVWRFLH